MYVTLYKTYMNVILGYSAPILHTPLPRVKFRVKFSLGFFRSGIRSAGTLQISMISPQAPYHTPPRPIPRILLQEGGDWAPLAGSGLWARLAGYPEKSLESGKIYVPVCNIKTFYSSNKRIKLKVEHFLTLK